MCRAVARRRASSKSRVTLVEDRLIGVSPLKGESTMCLNCGCGNLTRRQRPTDITQPDLRRAADGSYMSLATVIQNVRTALETLEAEQSGVAVRSTDSLVVKHR